MSNSPLGDAANPARPAGRLTATGQTRTRVISPTLRVIGRFRKHKLAMLGLTVVVLIVLIAIAAPVVAPHDPFQPRLDHFRQGPSLTYPLGTDAFGRDVLSRLIYGTRYSLPIGLLSTSLAILIGGPAGFVSGFYAATRRSWVDSLLMRTMDVILAFPSFLLALMLVSALGPSLENAMIAIGIVAIPVYARLARGAVLAIKEREFITAARVCGASDLWIMVRHVLPNSIQPIIVQGTLGVASAILTAAGLSFLGLGARPPTPEWGTMLNDGRAVLATAPWVTLFPGIAILLAVLAINLLGDGLRDALDPRIRA